MSHLGLNCLLPVYPLHRQSRVNIVDKDQMSCTLSAVRSVAATAPKFNFPWDSRALFVSCVVYNLAAMPENVPSDMCA